MVLSPTHRWPGQRRWMIHRRVPGTARSCSAARTSRSSSPLVPPRWLAPSRCCRCRSQSSRRRLPTPATHTPQTHSSPTRRSFSPTTRRSGGGSANLPMCWRPAPSPRISKECSIGPSINPGHSARRPLKLMPAPEAVSRTATTIQTAAGSPSASARQPSGPWKRGCIAPASFRAVLPTESRSRTPASTASASK